MLEHSILHEVAQCLSSVFLALGIPRPSAVILSLLYLINHPLDYSEISSLSGYSKSSVSQAVKFLEYHRLISRVKKGRRSAYRPSLPLRSALTELQARTIESAAHRLKERGKELPALRERIENLERELREAVKAMRYGEGRSAGHEP